MDPSARAVSAAVSGGVQPPHTATESDDASVFLAIEHLKALQASLERLLPSDESGPGAREAKVWRYIDRSLAGAYRYLAPMFEANLTALDRWATERHGKVFVDLPSAAQDSVLEAVEDGVATGFLPSSAKFFMLLREYAWQGMFGDPSHGGNAGFIGWDLVGFPGLRLEVPAESQNLDGAVPVERRWTVDLQASASGSAQ